MLAKLFSVALEGIEGIICEVEVDVARGGFDKTLIVGLEAKGRDNRLQGAAVAKQNEHDGHQVGRRA